MGVEPYLVCSSVTGIMAQRLVRSICPDCKRAYSPGDEERLVFENIRLKPDMNTLYKGVGCQLCLNTGYKGRTGIFELMTMDDTLRDLIMANTRSNVIKLAAAKKGMDTLFEDGLKKVLAGETTVEEVLRVTQDDII
jgi:general secretion pathway protein E